MTKNVIDFFIIGSAIKKNLFLTFLDGIKTSSNVISHISNPEIFKLIYFLTTDNVLGKEIKVELLNKWFDVYNLVTDTEKSFRPRQVYLSLIGNNYEINLEKVSPLIVADMLSEFRHDVSVKYTEKIRKIMINARCLLYNTIDNHSPFALLKFYNKYKKSILYDDVWFINFLLKRTAAKSKINETFKKIYIALLDDVKLLQKYNMFLKLEITEDDCHSALRQRCPSFPR